VSSIAAFTCSLKVTGKDSAFWRLSASTVACPSSSRDSRADSFSASAGGLELFDEFLVQHAAESNTIKTLTERLRSAARTFGKVRVDRPAVPEIAASRKRLPKGSAWHVHKAFLRS
jgi:hypothetical protein